MSLTSNAVPRLARLLSYLEHDEGNQVLRGLALRIACESAEWDLARQLIEEGLALDPSHTAWMAASGFVDLQQGQFWQVASVLQTALTRQRHGAAITYNLAMNNLMEQRYALELERVDGECHEQSMPQGCLLLARCLQKANRHAEAIVQCTRYLHWNKDAPEAHGLMGLLLHEQHRDDEARGHITLALAGDIHQRDALYARAGFAMRADDLAGASNAFEAVLQAHPDSARAWDGLAQLVYNDFQREPASVHLEAALRRLPTHASSWQLLAWSHLLKSEHAAARAALGSALDAALAQGSDAGETHGMLAVLDVIEGKPGAVAAIRLAMQVNEQSITARYAHMLLCQGQGDEAGAGVLLEQAMEGVAPDMSLPYRDMVAAHMRYRARTAAPALRQASLVA